MATILLADDHEDSREIFRAFLEFRGYSVIEAVDGENALEVIRQQGPDLVVLNLHMPTVGGHEVLERLRAEPETREIPCVVLTGDARYQEMGRAVASGADLYMTKPAEPRDVGEAVSVLLREGAAGAGSGAAGSPVDPAPAS